MVGGGVTWEASFAECYNHTKKTNHSLRKQGQEKIEGTVTKKTRSKLQNTYSWGKKTATSTYYWGRKEKRQRQEGGVRLQHARKDPLSRKNYLEAPSPSPEKGGKVGF